jgi:hypothetical protein
VCTVCAVCVQVSADLWQGMQSSSAASGVAAAGVTAGATAGDASAAAAGGSTTGLVTLCRSTSIE